MTQTAGPDLDKGGCAAALTRPARQVHLAVLGAFARAGQAPGRGELERIARAGGADPAAVLAELAERDVIAFGEAGEIRAAYPFSPSPTLIRVSWAGGPVVFAGATSGDYYHAADRTCGYINFFTSARAARAWAKANPAVTGKVLRQAWALSAGVAEFGAFMRAGDGTGPPDSPDQR